TRPAIEGKLTEPEWLGGLTQRLVSFDFYTRPPWANHGRWAALVGAALLVLLLPLFPAWLGLLLAVGSGIGLLAAFEYLLVFQRWWVALGTPAVLLFLGEGVTGVHGLLHHLRDLAYLADDGGDLPWWAEPRRRMARWMRRTYRRTRQQPAGFDPAMVLAGGAEVSIPPPIARPDARGRTRTPHLPDKPPDGIAARQSSRAASKVIDVMARGPKTGARAGTLESVRTLGRYTVENQLGKGAMGAVYRGVDPRINRVVAIKTLNLQQEFEAEELTQVKERFFHEAEVAGRLNHPHIVTIYDVGEDHGLGFIAMELIDGHDMRRYTRKGHLLPINRIMEMGAQVAEALDFAHRNGVVHRDIKPSNIMLDKAGRQVKVADFGIARIGTSGKTRTGTVLGTPPYMSPEQLSGRPVDGRSDVFSLGVVLFELIGGRRPFDGDTVAALMSRIANEPHPDLMALRGGVPACLRNIVDKALEKDPDKRYPNAGAMRLALLRCIENNYTGTGFGGRGA
ncbi:MAG TPA: serine/threonine protein kinase, partial [Gammaproteobacteria bacterium]|nr:serine/threonine protein kinase [Gammaproteobacteria bacterium]